MGRQTREVLQNGESEVSNEEGENCVAAFTASKPEFVKKRRHIFNLTKK